ncbi:tetratricopeptide repeat protein, partial [Sphingomonas bacterium]|uniref:tetratricopeptide repeat protein n=1 Tax=Sphingomonas bacterium TaxID=1895847 RepID=UPI001575E6A4
AAGGAEQQRDGRAGMLWSLAGNAALAADDAARAHTDLDRALASPALSPAMRGEAWFDRARAEFALNDLKDARISLDAGLKLVPADPFGWLLSATLARRDDDLDRAEKDVGEAARLAPDDAEVALEAGNVAAARGVIDAARIAWARAVELAPGDPAGKAAAQALAANR